MTQLRLTQRFAKDMGQTALTEPQTNLPPLDDWFMDNFRVNQKKVAIMMHAETLYTLLIPYKESNGAKQCFQFIPKLLQQHLSKALTATHQETLISLFQAPPSLVKTHDRSKLGSLNDMKRCAAFMIEYDEAPLTTQGLETIVLKLNETPMKALNYRSPQEAMKALLKQVQAEPLRSQSASTATATPLNTTTKLTNNTINLTTYRQQKNGISATDKLLNELIKTQEHSNQADILFLAAWKQGVKKLGANLFIVDAINIESAHCKDQLRPNVPLVKEVLHHHSSGEQALMGLMVSFYNPSDGQALLEQSGMINFVNALGNLDLTGRNLIAELWLNHKGW